MIVFYSGGSAIPETSIKDANVMLSFFVNVSRKTGKMDSRTKRIIKYRRTKKGKHGK